MYSAAEVYYTLDRKMRRHRCMMWQVMLLQCYAISLDLPSRLEDKIRYSDDLADDRHRPKSCLPMYPEPKPEGLLCQSLGE